MFDTVGAASVYIWLSCLAVYPIHCTIHILPFAFYLVKCNQWKAIISGSKTSEIQL